MEEIIKYKANDGVEFSNSLDALGYEKMLVEIKKLKSLISDQPDFNSSVGIQNSQENIKKFDESFRGLLIEYAPELAEKWDSNRKGIIGRYLSDGNCPIYNKIYNVYVTCVLRVGSDNKTYGQPYYANQIY